MRLYKAHQATLSGGPTEARHVKPNEDPEQMISNELGLGMECGHMKHTGLFRATRIFVEKLGIGI